MVVGYRCPGSCGELVQGQLNDQPVLVTCPINVFSYAYTTFQSSFCQLPPKAKQLIGTFSKHQSLSFSIHLTSEIPQGKGMSSSSADLSVCAALCYEMEQHTPTSIELFKKLLQIEPSDAIFYPGAVKCDHLYGSIFEPLGTLPQSKIILFDEGGEIDTIAFNRRQDLTTLRRQNEQNTAMAMDTLLKGLQEKNLSLIGTAATMSAYGNQSILYRPHLDQLEQICREEQGLGIIVAHSGTICGVLVDTPQEDAIIQKANERLYGKIRYMQTVEIYNKGMTKFEYENESTSF